MCRAFFFLLFPGLFGPFVSRGRCRAAGSVMQWAAWVGRGYCWLQEPSKTGQIMQEAGKKMSIYVFLGESSWISSRRVLRTTCQEGALLLRAALFPRNPCRGGDAATCFGFPRLQRLPGKKPG